MSVSVNVCVCVCVWWNAAHGLCSGFFLRADAVKIFHLHVSVFSSFFAAYKATADCFILVALFMLFFAYGCPSAWTPAKKCLFKQKTIRLLYFKAYAHTASRSPTPLSDYKHRRVRMFFIIYKLVPVCARSFWCCGERALVRLRHPCTHTLTMLHTIYHGAIRKQIIK